MMKRLTGPTLAALAFTGLAVLAEPTAALDWGGALKGALDTVTQDKSSDTGSSARAGTGAAVGLSTQELTAGLKEALRVGADTVARQLGAVDGFNSDPAVHIPLPKELQTVRSTLSRIGLASLADEVELKLNRGAEAAMPQAKKLVVDAISAMSLEDAKAIFNGPKDAATQYFRRVSGPDLEKTVAPVINRTLQDVGAVTAYDQLVGQYSTLPFVPDLKADLTAHATRLTLDGLFLYLAQEEAAIRENPAKRSSEILAKVFGAH